MTRESDLSRVRRWCEQLVPEDARSRVTVELETGSGGAIIVQRRAPWIGASRSGWSRLEVARLRHSAASGTWTLDWHDRNRWRPYTRLAATTDVDDLLEELDRDACGIFWGGALDSGGEERRRDVALA